MSRLVDMRRIRSARVQWVFTLECGHKETRQASVATKADHPAMFVSFRYAVARKRLHRQVHHLFPPAETILCRQCQAERYQ